MRVTFGVKLTAAYSHSRHPTNLSETKDMQCELSCFGLAGSRKLDYFTPIL